MPPSSITCSKCEQEFDDFDEFEDHDCPESDDDPDGGGVAALMADGGSYREATANAHEAWTISHQNGDKTDVVVTEIGSNFLAFAVDQDDGGDLLDTQVIDWTKTLTEAKAQAVDWMEDNPKGIQDGNGWLASISGGDN